MLLNLLFLVLFFLPTIRSAAVQDYDKCMLWLRTDGSSCQPGLFFKSTKFVLENMDVAPQDTDKVCCENGEGCFTIESKSPWECHLHIPQCLKQIKPEFFFYTPEEPDQPQMIDIFNINQTVANLKTSPKMRFFYTVTHGYGGTWPLDWQMQIKDRLIKLKNNVMVVRWTGGSNKQVGYFQAASNTRVVGKAISMIVKSLIAHDKAAINMTTLVGFSLGAHTSGYAGTELPGLRRIIALDPAGPRFQCYSPKARLDPSDAKFVVAIHTNGDYFLMNGMGTLQPLGHMDVYVNGGAYQPGCKRGVPEAVRDLIKLDIKEFIDDIHGIVGKSCNHNRAPSYFTELLDKEIEAQSGESCKFALLPCGSTDDYGKGTCFQCPVSGCPHLDLSTDVTQNTPGKFYFDTLKDDTSFGQFCGRQLRVTLQALTIVKGSIALNFRGNGMHSGDILLQDMYSTLMVGESKHAVVAIPWEMKRVDGVDIKYLRNQQHFAGNPILWKMQNFIVQFINGSTIKLQQPTMIRDGAINTINLS